MGWSLLERGARSIRLTHAGKVVYEEGKRLLSQVDQSVLRMKRAIGGGVIRIGYAPSLAAELLKSSMGCFSQRHPQVQLQLADCTTEEMKQGLRDGSLDLMIGVRSDEEDLAWQDLRQMECVLAVNEKDPLAKLETVKVGELEGRRFVLLSRHDYPGYWQGVIDYFSEQGMNAKVAGEFDGIESLALALQAGMGLALVASGAAVGEGVKQIPLVPAPAAIKVAAAWSAATAPDPLIAEFVEELRQFAD